MMQTERRISAARFLIERWRVCMTFHSPGDHRSHPWKTGSVLSHKEIKAYEWGTNISAENRNKGCTHGFILTFKNEKDRDTYLNHPAHKEFGKLVGPVLDDVFVIDFWAKE